jgi:ketosteroid isomerase-like protein
MEDHDIRAALDRHWAASDANDFEAEHQIYREDAVLEYPQSGEHIRGRRNIQASRFAQPSRKRSTIRRILGAADLWITEFVILRCTAVSHSEHHGVQRREGWRRCRWGCRCRYGEAKVNVHKPLVATG